MKRVILFSLCIIGFLAMNVWSPPKRDDKVADTIPPSDSSTSTKIVTTKIAQ